MGAPGRGGRRRDRRAHGIFLAASTVILGTALLRPMAAAAGPTGPQSGASTPSAIGRVIVKSITISPAYRRTATVAVVAGGGTSDCRRRCTSLWISHNGGATWRRAAAENWIPSDLVIAVDSRGHEIFLGAGEANVARSDDDGETWRPIGEAGRPTVLPSFAKDGGIVVASDQARADYVLNNVGEQDVEGSADRYIDQQFAMSPQFPQAGRFMPVLLAAGDARHRTPVILQCSATFSCQDPVALPQPQNTYRSTTSGITVQLATDYAHSGVVFANTFAGIERSEDGGAHFSMLDIVPTTGASVTFTPSLALDPRYGQSNASRTLYVAVQQVFDRDPLTVHGSGGIYTSEDDGAMWHALASDGPFAGGASAVAVAPDGRFFAGFEDGSGNTGLVCSVDGRSWRAACPAEDAGLNADTVRGHPTAVTSDGASDGPHIGYLAWVGPVIAGPPALAALLLWRRRRRGRELARKNMQV